MLISTALPREQAAAHRQRHNLSERQQIKAVFIVAPCGHGNEHQTSLLDNPAMYEKKSAAPAVRFSTAAEEAMCAAIPDVMPLSLNYNPSCVRKPGHCDPGTLTSWSFRVGIPQRG